MKKESRERIIKAYEDAATALGFPTLNRGLGYMCAELEKTLQKLRPVRNRAALEAVLTKDTEPSQDHLDATIKSIELLPRLVRRHLPEATKQIIKTLPHEPGGRPQAVSSEEHPKICQEIAGLFAQGVSLKVAQERVARRRDVSPRTIQRIWQRRKEFANPEVSNITEA